MPKSQGSANTIDSNKSIDLPVPDSRILGSGGINFYRNYSFEAKSHPFFYVCHDIRIDGLIQNMIDCWNLQMPRIVGMVISDLKASQNWSNSRQIVNFQVGLMKVRQSRDLASLLIELLIKAAVTTNMWIFTAGADIGIHKKIGDAVNEKIKEQLFLRDSRRVNRMFPFFVDSLTFIGILRDTNLRGRNAFRNQVQILSVSCFLFLPTLYLLFTYPHQDNQARWPKIKVENLGNLPQSNRYELNPDHTHFLIVRDKTSDNSGFNKFLMQLLRHLSVNEKLETIHLSQPKDSNELNGLIPIDVPIVGLLISGGLESSLLVSDFMKNLYPVVVLQGTGGLADLIGFVHTEIHDKLDGNARWGDWEPDFIDSYLVPEIHHRISHLLPEINSYSSKGTELRDRILNLVQLAWTDPNSHLEVININSSAFPLDNISVYLLRALFKSKAKIKRNLSTDNVAEERIYRELYLAMDWNCVDVAKSDVITNDPLFISRLPRDAFMRTIFCPDRESFVDLFLSHGFRVHGFLSPLRLRKLFMFSYEEEFFRTVCWEGILGHSPLNKPGRNFVEDDLNYLIEICTGLTEFINSDHLFYNLLTLYVRDAATAERHAVAVLAMWAVFSNRVKLAKTFWKHSDSPIHLALILSMIMEKMAPYIPDTNIQESVRKEAQIFSCMAVGVLDECYKISPSRAFDLLSESSQDWSNMTAVDLAASAEIRVFTAHAACQKWLSNEFMGQIHVREASWGILQVPTSIKLILSAYLMWPMYFWVQFRTSDQLAHADIDAEELEHEEKVIADQLAEKGKKMDLKIPSNNQQRGLISQIRAREFFIFQGIPLWKMVFMLWSAPITKFYNHQLTHIFYVAFLLYTILQPPCAGLWPHKIVCWWTLTHVLEFFRRYISFCIYGSTKAHKGSIGPIQTIIILSFLAVFWANVYQWNIYYLTLDTYHLKVLLSFGIVYFFFRLLAVYLRISPTLGPMIYRVQLMVLEDFINFMKISLIAILAGGAIIQALLYPDGVFGVRSVRKAFDRAWFSLFVTPLDDLQDRSNCYQVSPNSLPSCRASIYNDTTGLDCPYVNVWPYVFLIAYFVLLKLVLLTLLFALFTNSGQRIEEESDAIWKYQRYILVIDFTHRLPFPCPFSIFAYPFLTIKVLLATVKSLCNSTKKRLYTIRNNLVKLTRARSYPQRMSILRTLFSMEATKTVWDAAKKPCKLSCEDFNYWKILARKYSERMEREMIQKQMTSRIWEDIRYNLEQLEEQKNCTRKLDIRVNELRRIVRSLARLPGPPHPSPSPQSRESIKRSSTKSLSRSSRH